MKIKLLSICMTVAALSATLFQSCKKNDPNPPNHNPVDSSHIVDLKRGLLLYLPFSGNFADSSGNNNPTTALGGITLSTDRFGTSNTAMNGSGTGQRVVVSNNGSIKFDSAFTFSANVLSRRQHDECFVSMANRANATGVSFGFGYGIPGNNHLNFTAVNGNVSCIDHHDPSNSTTDTSNLTLPDNQWYNLVVTFKKGTLKMYANGVLISTKIGLSQTVPVCPTAEVVVGGWWDGDPQSIDGKMDEVRLYNRALNDEEIAKLSQGFPAPSGPDLKSGLLVYLPFSGNYADSSGNNNPTTALADVALTSDMSGTPSTAMSGTGNGGRIVVSNNGSIKFDSTFTFSANVLSNRQHDECFVSMAKRADATGVTFGFGYGIPGINHLNFTAVNGNVSCDDHHDVYNSTTDTSGLTLTDNKWYNLVITFNRGTLKMYSNGVLISTKVSASKTVPVCPSADLVIGGWWDGDPQSIDGKMDEVRLYNRELSGEEITQLAKNFH